ncbi:hypothetical protein [Sphingobium cloacae]|uniref:DUF1648 domain-containing protein n=1 Tax=Sphingobium cloacae TaxID=120107 RepID=A0A1E1F2C5_9SPHN|nr:hypothetical protein [Sphingobium cloacae]BAV64664.1 hypothetical protein SCLO_1016240 [Sphingobium cloacae]
MIVLSLAVIFAVILAGLSIWANARFRHHERLPMQWSLTGAVNWTAPRALALSLVPALATGMLAFIAVLALNVRPRAGQENMVLPVTIMIGATFIAVHLFHFRLIDKTIKRNGG